MRGQNPCARDFFVDDDGDGTADDAVHNLADDYDPTRSGQANMDAQSRRFIDGDGTIKKFVPATLSW